MENGTPKKERISVQGSQDGSLGITRNPGDPAITSVSPSGILFPAMDGKYSFTVNGDGFSPIGNYNKLIIATNDTDEGKTQDVCWRNSKLEESKDEVYNKCVIKTNASVNFIDTQHLQFQNVSFKNNNGAFDSNLGIRVKVSTAKSNFIPLSISRVAYPVPLFLAAGIVSALTAAIWWIIAKGTKKNLIHWLLLDAETNTYSLSRLQFYLWTLVAILSYFFLLFSRNLSQGKLGNP